MPRDLPITNEEWEAWLDRGGERLEADQASSLVAEVLRLRKELGIWFDCAQPPTVVYHYCPSEAFTSIIEKGELWLFDSADSNDLMENSLPMEAVRRIASEVIGEQELPAILQIFEGTRATPFMTCFSELPDSLSQWRAYARNGTGFAIGIDPRRLGCRFGPPLLEWKPSEKHITVNRQVALVRMIYERNVFEDSVRSACTRQYEGLVAADGPVEKANARAGMVSLLHSLSLCGKHRGFREEREWRLLHHELMQIDEHADSADSAPAIRVQRSVQHNVQFVNGTSRQFTRFTLGAGSGVSPIVSVVRGPCNRIEDHDLRALLNRNGLIGVPIDRTEVPYRGA